MNVIFQEMQLIKMIKFKTNQWMITIIGSFLFEIKNDFDSLIWIKKFFENWII